MKPRIHARREIRNFYFPCITPQGSPLHSKVVILESELYPQYRKGEILKYDLPLTLGKQDFYEFEIKEVMAPLSRCTSGLPVKADHGEVLLLVMPILKAPEGVPVFKKLTDYTLAELEAAVLEKKKAEDDLVIRPVAKPISVEEEKLKALKDRCLIYIDARLHQVKDLGTHRMGIVCEALELVFGPSVWDFLNYV